MLKLELVGGRIFFFFFFFGSGIEEKKKNFPIQFHHQIKFNTYKRHPFNQVSFITSPIDYKHKQKEISLTFKPS